MFINLDRSVLPASNQALDRADKLIIVGSTAMLRRFKVYPGRPSRKDIGQVVQGNQSDYFDQQCSKDSTIGLIFAMRPYFELLLFRRSGRALRPHTTSAALTCDMAS
jgi:hypothetical protein